MSASGKSDCNKIAWNWVTRTPCTIPPKKLQKVTSFRYLGTPSASLKSFMMQGFCRLKLKTVHMIIRPIIMHQCWPINIKNEAWVSMIERQNAKVILRHNTPWPRIIMWTVTGKTVRKVTDIAASKLREKRSVSFRHTMRGRPKPYDASSNGCDCW